MGERIDSKSLMAVEPLHVDSLHVDSLKENILTVFLSSSTCNINLLAFYQKARLLIGLQNLFDLPIYRTLLGMQARKEENLSDWFSQVGLCLYCQ